LDDVSAAAALLRAGGLVAFPTETVYGLGARFDRPAAIAAVFAAKDRPPDNPLIVHCDSLDQLHRVAAEVPRSAMVLLDAFAPGPLTVVVPRNRSIDRMVTAGHDTVAVRIPAEPIARALIATVGHPLVAPSANRSGRPSPTHWQAVWQDLAGRIDGILRGEVPRYGLESTVVDCTTDPPVVLRCGALPLETIQQVLPQTRLAHADDLTAGRSPGVRHRHYSPRAIVVPFGAESELPADDRHALCLAVAPPGAWRLDARFGLAIAYADLAAYAQGLYAAFRDADDRGFTRIYCQWAPSAGVGRAINDRLERAAQADSA
jgi:L-threonylcarbamoyladenylate synthase